MKCRELSFSCVPVPRDVLLPLEHPLDLVPSDPVHEGPAVGTAQLPAAGEYLVRKALHLREGDAGRPRALADRQATAAAMPLRTSSRSRPPLTDSKKSENRSATSSSREITGTALIFIEVSEKSSMSNPISENVSIFSMMSACSSSESSMTRGNARRWLSAECLSSMIRSKMTRSCAA